MRRAKGLVVFDLDKTLLSGRTIIEISQRFGVARDVQRIWDAARGQELAAGWQESQSIAALFRGQDVDEFTAACAAVPLRADAKRTVQRLQGLGLRVGVASASYHVATHSVRQRLGLDFEVGARLQVRNGRLTGRLLPSRFQGPCRQFVCKEAALGEWARRAHVSFTVGVGDGANDVCLLSAATLGVSFGDAHPRARAAAQVHVDRLRDLVPLVERRLAQSTDAR